MPPDAIAIFPGCDFAGRDELLDVSTWSDGFANRNIGETPMIVTGEKSFTGSYGTFAWMLGLIVCGMSERMIV